jgi:hypothetical protein
MTRATHHALKASVAAVALSIAALQPHPALARLQIKDLQKGKTINVLECTDQCTVDLKFQLVSTGFDALGRPDFQLYTVTAINEFVSFKKGDRAFDILSAGTATQDCVKLILPGAPCDVTATFKINDNDVDDDEQSDAAATTPDAIWTGHLDVSYRISGDDLGHSVFGQHNVGILDDDAGAGAPEPSVWASLVLGFGLVGAGFRRRRIIA